MAYDSYGNPSVLTDELGSTTTNGYDATYTFLTAGTSPLGPPADDDVRPAERADAERHGSEQRDGLFLLRRAGTEDRAGDRGPGDGADQRAGRDGIPGQLRAVPHQDNRLHADGQGRADRGTTRSSDGWGRKLQVRQPAEEAGRQTVTGAAAYDANGRMIKQWTSYADAFSEEYVPVPVASLAAPEEYTYDPVGRVLTTTTANGHTSYVSYNDNVTTYTDAKGNVQSRLVDGYGRVVSVKEKNGGETYTTTYAYDVNGRLIRVTDHIGNVDDEHLRQPRAQDTHGRSQPRATGRTSTTRGAC